ncbi:putative penicillin-binding protein [Kineosphaera limosa NBRC 100340]|uniref:Putative penicillin-binding protein n=1 Tax=Kineosphaera limosa NBRC 100340 TaxID=1184609 RepID=K6XEQ8_9MICO|nr:putative penicillin-binding protein [Kineosphaera limosa NBRC 100340]
MGNAFSLLGAFVALSMVAGLLGAGIFVPVVGLAGLTAKEAIGTFDSLPAEFTASPMAQQSEILAKDGTVLATLYEENRTVVPLDKIAPIMQDAQIAIEDDRFYEHGGVDARGIARALFQTLQGDKQGASTITQQYVKQTRVYTALKEEDDQAAEAAQARGGIPGIVRKLQEAKYSIALEEKLSKKQILEGYLNLIYYGAGAYGVEAAAMRYFGVSAADLSLPQAAMIAGMAQRPGATDPFQYPDRAKARRDDVLQRMRDTGKISTQRMRQAMRTSIELNPTRGQASCPASKDPYFCDFVKAWLMEQPGLGDTPAEREKRIYRGGLKIETTYDLALNEQVKKTLEQRLPVGNRAGRGTAAAVVEPGTGHIVALAQNTDYATGQSKEFGKTSVNWTVDQRYGGSAGFQIGSTAKMFAVVTAMEKGLSAGTNVYAPADGTRFSAGRLGGTECGYTGSFAPSNAESREQGNMTLAHAAAMSVNTAFVQLASMVGVCNERATMKKMGLHTATGGEYGESGMAAVILGADNASPLTVASAYATLAAGGKRCDPVPVTKITDFNGQGFKVSDGNCEQVLDPNVAYRATRILTGVWEGTGRNVGRPDGRAAAGKTGTTDRSMQTWFAGFTPQRAGAVWVGTPDPPRPMPGVYGATYAGPLWRDVIAATSKGLPREQFRVISADGNSSSDQIEVPNVIGRSENSATRRLQEAGFKVNVASRKVRANTIPWGRVADTSLEAGEIAPKGETVTLYLSRGIPAAQQANNRTPRSTATRNSTGTPSPSSPDDSASPSPTN